MSNSLAIAAVTATLRNLLTQGLTSELDLADTSVTMQPLDRARTNGQTANQINLFLYHVLPSAAWRNTDPAWVTRPGESGAPPVGLNLFYLLTAYGRDNDMQRPFSHQILGRAIGILNDHPVLGTDEIQAALTNNDLWKQVERVRITMQPFSVEEIAKLWTGFQTQYRLSVAYEVAVVLIDSRSPVTAPVPVLTRGRDDSGVTAQANLLPPFALLKDVVLPKGQVSARLGDTITLIGQVLDGAVQAQFVPFVNGMSAEPRTIPVTVVSSTSLTVPLPTDGAAWPAGLYTVAVLASTGTEPATPSNQLPLSIAPRITSKLPMTVKRVKGVATLNLTCSPDLQPHQRVEVIVGSQVLQMPSPNSPTDQIAVQIQAAVAGESWLRLRVDGVDSLLVDRSAALPVFDPTQKVKIT